MISDFCFWLFVVVEKFFFFFDKNSSYGGDIKFSIGYKRGYGDCEKLIIVNSFFFEGI